MLEEILFALVTAVIVVAVTIARPTKATCPAGWYLETGIKPSGVFRCAPDVIGGINDPAGGIDTAVQPPGAIMSRIWCTNGTMPIVVNHTTVGCQRGGWQQ